MSHSPLYIHSPSLTPLDFHTNPAPPLPAPPAEQSPLKIKAFHPLDKNLARLDEAGALAKNSRLKPDFATIPLPALLEDEVCNIQGMLNLPIQFHIHKQIKTASKVEHTIIISKTFRELLEDLQKTSADKQVKVESIEIVGGAVSKALGISYFRRALGLLIGKPSFPLTEEAAAYLLMAFNDLDTRYNVPDAPGPHLGELGNAACDSIAKAYTQEENELQEIKSLIKMKKNAFRHWGELLNEEGNYFVISCNNNNGPDVEILATRHFRKTYLFGMQDLRIAITPLLQKEPVPSVHIVPQGEHVNGWQALVDKAARILYIDNPEDVGKRWVLLYWSFLVRGYRCHQSQAEPILVRKVLKEFTAKDIKSNTGRILESHHKNDPQAALALAYSLSLSLYLHSDASDDKIKQVFFTIHALKKEALLPEASFLSGFAGLLKRPGISFAAAAAYLQLLCSLHLASAVPAGYAGVQVYLTGHCENSWQSLDWMQVITEGTAILLPLKHNHTAQCAEYFLNALADMDPTVLDDLETIADVLLPVKFFAKDEGSPLSQLGPLYQSDHQLLFSQSLRFLGNSQPFWKKVGYYLLVHSAAVHFTQEKLNHLLNLFPAFIALETQAGKRLSLLHSLAGYLTKVFPQAFNKPMHFMKTEAALKSADVRIPGIVSALIQDLCAPSCLPLSMQAYRLWNEYKQQLSPAEQQKTGLALLARLQSQEPSKAWQIFRTIDRKPSKKNVMQLFSFLYHFSCSRQEAQFTVPALELARHLAQALAKNPDEKQNCLDGFKPTAQVAKGFLWLLEQLRTENHSAMALELLQATKPLHIIPASTFKKYWLLLTSQSLNTPLETWSSGKNQGIWEGTEQTELEGLFLLHLFPSFFAQNSSTSQQAELLNRLCRLPLTAPQTDRRILLIQQWMEKTLQGQSLIEAENTLAHYAVKYLPPSHQWQARLQKAHAEKSHADTSAIEKTILSLLAQLPSAQIAEKEFVLLSEILSAYFERSLSRPSLQFLSQLLAQKNSKNIHPDMPKALHEWCLKVLDQASHEIPALSKPEAGLYAGILENVLQNLAASNYSRQVAESTGKFLLHHAHISTAASALQKSLMLPIRAQWGLLIPALLSSPADMDTAAAIIKTLFNDHRLDFKPSKSEIEDILHISAEILKNPTDSHLTDAHFFLDKLAKFHPVPKDDTSLENDPINKKIISLLSLFIPLDLEKRNGAASLRWFDEYLNRTKAYKAFELDTLRLGKLCAHKQLNQVKHANAIPLLKKLPKECGPLTTRDDHFHFYSCWKEIFDLLAQKAPYTALQCLVDKDFAAVPKNNPEWIIQIVAQASENLLAQEQQDKSCLAPIINALKLCKWNACTLKALQVAMAAFIKKIMHRASLNPDSKIKDAACQFFGKLAIEDDFIDAAPKEWMSCWHLNFKIQATLSLSNMEPLIKDLLDPNSVIYRLCHREVLETEKTKFIGQLLYHIFHHVSTINNIEKQQYMIEETIKIKSLYYDFCFHSMEEKEFAYVSNAMVQSVVGMYNEALNITLMDHLLAVVQNARTAYQFFYQTETLVKALLGITGRISHIRPIFPHIITLPSLYFNHACDAIKNKLRSLQTMQETTEYYPVFQYILAEASKFYDIDQYIGIPSQIYDMVQIMMEKQGSLFDCMSVLHLLKHIPTTLILRLMYILAKKLLDNLREENSQKPLEELQSIKLFIKEFITKLTKQQDPEFTTMTQHLLDHPVTAQLLHKAVFDVLKKSCLVNVVVHQLNSANQEIVNKGFTTFIENLDSFGQEQKQNMIRACMDKLCEYLESDSYLFFVDETCMHLLYAIAGQKINEKSKRPLWNLSGHVSKQLQAIQDMDFDMEDIPENSYPHLQKILAAKFEPKKNSWNETIPLEHPLDPDRAKDLQFALVYYAKSLARLVSNNFQIQAYSLVKIGTITETLMYNCPENKSEIIDLFKFFWFRHNFKEPAYMLSFLTVGTTLYTIAKEQNLLQDEPELCFSIELMIHLKPNLQYGLFKPIQDEIIKVVKKLTEFPSLPSLCRAIKIVQNTAPLLEESPTTLSAMYHSLLFANSSFPRHQQDGKVLLRIVLDSIMANKKFMHPGDSYEWKSTSRLLLTSLYDHVICHHEKNLNAGNKYFTSFLEEYRLLCSFEEYTPSLTQIEKIANLLVSTFKIDPLLEQAEPVLLQTYVELPLQLLSKPPASAEPPKNLKTLKRKILADYIKGLSSLNHDHLMEAAKKTYPKPLFKQTE